MIIKCKNMTHAMKAKRLLSDWGIESDVKKINDDPNVSGCVYSIAFESKNYDTVIRVLKAGNVVLHKTEAHRFGDGE